MSPDRVMGFALVELFWVGIVPCAVAAALILGCRRLAIRPAAAWPISVSVALVVGQLGLAARTNWRMALDALVDPREARDWLPWLVLVAAGMEVLRACADRPWAKFVSLASAPYVVLAGMFMVTVPARLLSGSVYVTSRWSAERKFGVLLLLSCVLAATWYLLAAGRASGQPRLCGGLLVVVAAGMAITIALSGSFTTGELCGVVAAALTGTVLASECLDATGSARAETDGPSGAAGVLAIALGGLILLAYYYASLTATGAALLTVAVVAAGGPLPTGWPRDSLPQAAVRVTLCLVPLAIAVALAVAAATADPYAA